MLVEIQIDRGTDFVTESWKLLYKCLRAIHQTSTAHRPKSQGVTESNNSILVNISCCYINENQTDWYKYVKFVKLAYNSG